MPVLQQKGLPERCCRKEASVCLSELFRGKAIQSAFAWSCLCTKDEEDFTMAMMELVRFYIGLRVDILRDVSVMTVDCCTVWISEL